ncbi:MAG: ABC transporter ATP-binding protein [Alphaproteobacteria bacterium]
MLKIENLAIHFGETKAVKNATLDIKKGEIVALVGESGSGKSATALSILGLHDAKSVSYGKKSSISFEGKNLLTTEENVLQKIRGKDIAMIFQEPMTSLNPLHTIEKQITEALLLHKKLLSYVARKQVIDLLETVGLSGATERLSAYPHQLSGGQRQRVMIAMALANDPKLLIADEPTTALDVTTQAQIIKLLKELQKKKDLSVLLITHNLPLVRQCADRVFVMKEGKIVENGTTKQIFGKPTHAYTKMLMNATPKGALVPLKKNAETLLTAQDVNVRFPLQRNKLFEKKKFLHAVNSLSLSISKGQTVGIVGESGSGKTTLAMSVLSLQKFEGDIRFQGTDLAAAKKHDLKKLRQKIQVIFQDPYGSLNPRMSVGRIIEEGAKAHRLFSTADARRIRAEELLKNVGLEKEIYHRYPHQLSGGQRQRIALARALILDPDLLVLDEPTSALDVSTQIQLLKLLKKQQKEDQRGYLLISHDMQVIQSLSHYVIVMKDGKIVEQGEAKKLFSNPQEPYTKTLLAAAV